MESQQPPLKRTRTHSTSSGSNSNHPTKAAKTETHAADVAHPDESQAEASDSSGVEGPEKDEHNPRTGKSEDPQPHRSNHTPEAGLGVQENPEATGSAGREPNVFASESAAESEPKQDDLKPVVYSNGDWGAVYHPESNAYYFVNSKTGETTWTNPLVPNESDSVVSSQPGQPSVDLLGGIDPELAYLDPQMARLVRGHSSQSEPRLTARFNAKTGRFEGDPTRDPSRVSEFARARTQAEAFFDVAGWEKTLEKHNGRIPGTSKETRAAALEQGKKLSKAQLNQFKQQKMEKKVRNQRAWLT